MGLSLPVLANEASGPGKQISVIFMFLQGGASQLDMYDMKPMLKFVGNIIRFPLAFQVSSYAISCPVTDKFSLIRSMHSRE